MMITPIMPVFLEFGITIIEFYKLILFKSRNYVRQIIFIILSTFPMSFSYQDYNNYFCLVSKL